MSGQITVESTEEASMNKSKSAPTAANASKPASDGNPDKTVAKKIAPVAAKTGKGDTEPAQDLASKSKSRVGSDAEHKQDSRSAKTVAAVTSDDQAGNVEKTAVSKVSEVATKTSKSTSSVSNDGALLSEAQILKMSDKDYMNAAQLAFFKARLQQLEKDLLKNAGETTEHLRETVLVPDPADRATIEEEHALELRTRDRERKLLKKVQQSIASIDAGDYGWCEETGEPIGIPRLLARPTATLSLEAQQRRELKQKLYGD
jgi:DnaK suppressor protein